MDKSFEEFYTDEEAVDFDRFSSLSVITDKSLTDTDEILRLLKNLEAAFQKNDVTKDDIIAIIENYLPYFEHIEKGKSLDAKM